MLDDTLDAVVQVKNMTCDGHHPLHNMWRDSKDGMNQLVVLCDARLGR